MPAMTPSGMGPALVLNGSSVSYARHSSASLAARLKASLQPRQRTDNLPSLRHTIEQPTDALKTQLQVLSIRQVYTPSRSQTNVAATPDPGTVLDREVGSAQSLRAATTLIPTEHSPSDFQPSNGLTLLSRKSSAHSEHVLSAQLCHLQTDAARAAFVEKLEAEWRQKIELTPELTKKKRSRRKRHRRSVTDSLTNRTARSARHDSDITPYRITGISNGTPKSAVNRHRKRETERSVERQTDEQLRVHTSLIAAAKAYGVAGRKPFQAAGETEVRRITKVYLSDKQTTMVRDGQTRYPGAPPCTPHPDSTPRYEYIPSMSDIRSQRAVRNRLQEIEDKQTRRSERRRAEKEKQRKVEEIEAELALKKQQRNMIYALNKVMTDFEYKNYQRFCTEYGLTADPKR